MTTRIFVCPETIQNNAATGRHDKTIVVVKDGLTSLCHEAIIQGPSRVVYDPKGKKKYGARVFVQTESPVQLIADIKRLNDLG